MKSLAILIMICCTVVAVVCLVLRTELPAQFWIWVMGLAGPLIGVVQLVVHGVKKLMVDEQRESEREKKIRSI